MKNILNMSLAPHFIKYGSPYMLSVKYSTNVSSAELAKSYPPRVVVVNGRDYALSLDKILGFFEGDGSLTIQTITSSSHLEGKQVRLIFCLYQHSVDKDLLIAIQTFLGMGKVSINKTQKDGTRIYMLRIVKHKDLMKLANILRNVRMVLAKRAYEVSLFLEAWEIVESKAHLTLEGLNRLEVLKTEKLTTRDPKKIRALPLTKDMLVPTGVTLSKDWVVGFMDAEGNIQTGVYKAKTGAHGLMVVTSVSISQERCEIPVLQALADFFGCGSVNNTKPEAKAIPVFKVANREDLLEKIIPFFEENQLMSIKRSQMMTLKEVILYWKANLPLQPKHFESIQTMVKGPNRK